MSAERQWPDFEWSPEAKAAVGRAIASFNHPARNPGAILDAAVKAQPVVALPPCPTCDGTGVDEAEIEPDVARVCPACDGSGVAAYEHPQKAALRAWIEEREPYRSGSWRYSAALNDLSAFLDSLHAEPGTYHRG